MKPLSVRPPHLERLLDRVRALDGPLIQLWAWPGAGQQAVLDALIEDARFGQPLSLEALADEASLARAVESAFEGGARWLVLPAVPGLPGEVPAGVATIARLLAPGQRLVFAAPRKRPPGPLACSYLLPPELLLRRDELADLWRDVSGTTPGRRLLDRLLAATDGWYRPLRLAAEEAAAAAGSVEPRRIVELPSVASFLRHEVLALLDPEDRELLLRLSAGHGLAPVLWHDLLSADEARRLRRLVEVWGLALDGGGEYRGDEHRGGEVGGGEAGGAAGEPRLPRLLVDLLEQQRPALWTVERRRRLAADLADAELALDRPVAALEQLVAARLGERVTALLAERWTDLLAAVPMELLGRALEVTEGAVEEGGTVELLRHLHGALAWRRPAALNELRRLATEETAAVATVAHLAVVLLDREGARADDPPPGRSDPPGPPGPAGQGGPGAGPPPSLRALRVLAELLAGEDGDGDDPGSGAVVERLLPVLDVVDPGRGPSAVDRRPHPALTLRQALARHGLSRLMQLRPSLVRTLDGHPDLPPAWQRWLAGLPPARPAEASSGYSVQLLGKPAVRRHRAGGGSEELRFPLRRAFLVFARLASAPGFEASRDDLVAAAFHDEDDEVVEKNFHPTLSYVRRTLAAGDEEVRPVRLHRGVYQLDPALPWNVDVGEFERRVDEGRRRLRAGQPERAVALWESAWRLYAGPFLAGWDAPWIDARRDALARQHGELLVTLGEAYERLERLTQAMDVFRAALISDPMQEPVHLALMRIYARQGRRDLVRRQYDRLSSLLSEELGVEPMPDTTAAYHRLMS